MQSSKAISAVNKTDISLFVCWVQDLFTQTVGQVTRVQLSYDKNGKSTGKAEIDFRKPGDAQIAYNSYNTRLVDGSKLLSDVFRLSM